MVSPDAGKTRLLILNVSSRLRAHSFGECPAGVSRPSSAGVSGKPKSEREPPTGLRSADGPDLDLSASIPRHYWTEHFYGRARGQISTAKWKLGSRAQRGCLSCGRGLPKPLRLAPAVGPRRCASSPPGLLRLKPSYCFFGYGRQSHCEAEAFEGQQSGNRQLPPISTVLLADLILSVCGRFAKKPT